MRRYPERSPYAFTEAKMARWIKAGRGAGEGASYRPWLETRNVRSRGRKSRLPGILHDRVMHLMSDLERNAVLFYERVPSVLDIREQFPMDREVTRSIARAMGVLHPRDPATKTDIVMTTDLLVTFRASNGLVMSRPLSVKPEAEMLDHRTVVKQEIERRYWERQGLVLQLLLDRFLRRKVYFKSILWAREWFYLPDWDVEERMEFARHALIVESELRRDDRRLDDAVGALVRQLAIRADDVVPIIRHLIARGRIDYDFELGIPDMGMMTSVFRVCSDEIRLVA